MAAIYYEVLSEHIKQKIRQHTCSLDELKLVHENLKKNYIQKSKAFNSMIAQYYPEYATQFGKESFKTK